MDDLRDTVAGPEVAGPVGLEGLRGALDVVLDAQAGHLSEAADAGRRRRRDSRFEELLERTPSTLAVARLVPERQDRQDLAARDREVPGGERIEAGGQKSVALSAVGQVRSARRPPELVIAKSVPYCWRIASVTTSPTSDSQARPSERPVSARAGVAARDGHVRARVPTCCAEDRQQLRRSAHRSRAWIAGPASCRCSTACGSPPSCRRRRRPCRRR